MSARRRAWSVWLFVTVGACGPVLAEEAGEPDMELLEYLGYWEESDEDWVMIESRLERDTDESTGPASDDEVPVENDHES